MSAVESGAGLPAKEPTILIVCTANLCRSPAAEFLLRNMLGANGADLRIDSAGTAAADGAPIDPVMDELLNGRGFDTAGFRSRPVSRELLASADLILTAAANNGAAVGRLLPATVRRTLTLKKLARYAPFIATSGEPPASGADRIAWLLSAVPRARARPSGTRHGNDDIADPIGLPRRRYVLALAEIERACAAIAPLLRTGLVSQNPEQPRPTNHAVDLPEHQPEGTWLKRPGDPPQAARSFFDWAFK